MPQQSTPQTPLLVPNYALSNSAPMPLSVSDLARVSGAGLVEAQQLPHNGW